MFVKPAPGLKVRDPETKALVPDEGQEVPDHSMHWHRLLNDGDVVLANAVRAKAKKAAEGGNE